MNENKSLELIIKRLCEIKAEFPKHANMLEHLIDRIKKDGYTEIIDKYVKDTLCNQIFCDTRLYMISGGINGAISDYYYSIGNLYELERKTIYNKETSSYKVIPYKFLKEDEEKLSLIYTEATCKLIDIFFKKEGMLLKIIEAETEVYKGKVIEIKNTLKNNNLDPYYGSKGYMIEKINFILNCLEDILNSKSLNSDVKYPFIDAYNKCKDLIGSININDNSIDFIEEYIYIENIYKRILDIEQNVSIYMEGIWKQFLTNPKDFVSGGEYRLLAHCVSGEYVEENELGKVCTTLITDKCSPIPNYGDYGFIMDISMEQISTMSTEDSGSWLVTKDRFIDNNLPVNWQLSEKIDEYNYVFYEEPSTSKLILPWVIEEKMIANNLNNSGATVGIKATLYSEIFMKRTDIPLKVLAFFALNDKGLEKINKINNTLSVKKNIIDLRYLYDNTNSYGNIDIRK